LKYDLSIQADLNNFKFKTEYHISKGNKVELKAIRTKRTVKQNSYLHVLFALYGMEIGLTLEESKTLVKRTCPFMTYEKKGTKFLKKASLLNTEEMTKFIDWFRTWSSQQGIYLPTSEEYIVNMLFIDNQIEKMSEFL